jgi:glycosyltransferase involved in cell wall biosynthesis
MKIAHAHTDKYLDIRNSSGLGHYIAKAFRQQECEIEFLPDLTVRYKRLLKAKELYYRALGYRYQRSREIFVAKDYARQIATRISRSADVVFSPGSIPLAYLDIDKPKVFYTDGTFAGMLGFYGSLMNLCPENIKQGHEIEQAALDSCSLAIYASDWAAQTAIDNYQVKPEKVKVVPFGANIECDRTRDDIKEIVRNRSRITCKLLFLGVDWERKGGDKAVKIMQALNEAGLKTELHVAGIRAFPMTDLPENVIDHGFISKTTAEGRSRIDRLLTESHFLILPTRAECFGLVFCEANSFGVPDIATRVGGIPTVVRDGINGMLFPLAASEDEYADYILKMFTDYDAYQKLALSSFDEYQKRLNWKVSGKKIIDLMENLV